MRITGITLFGVGGVASVVGAGLVIKSAMTHCLVPLDAGSATVQAHRSRMPSPAAQGERIGTAQQALSFCGSDPVPGFALLIGGITGSLVGIPFLVLGNERVPVLPEVSIGAGSADLRVRF